MALMGVSLLLGIIETALVPEPATGDRAFLVELFGTVVMLLVGFYWLHFDSRERGIRRPTWLNIGIVMLALVFVPYYLYKTRPAGRRATPIVAFFGLIFGSVVMSSVGALLMSSLQSGGSGA
jgi:hypothetical protein